MTRGQKTALVAVAILVVGAACLVTLSEFLVSPGTLNPLSRTGIAIFYSLGVTSTLLSWWGWVRG